MVATIITVDDLDGYPGINLPGDASVLERRIEDALAMASLPAPCILEDAFLQDEKRVAQVRAVLRTAIVRWNEAGSGAAANLVSGPFQAAIDNRPTRKVLFWPSEIEQLREICADFKGKTKARAYSIDTAPTPGPGTHADVCSLHFGALYCSCGSDINRGEGPIYEAGP